MADARDARSEEVARVFVCYRQDDTGPTAAHLANDLQAALGERKVFYDREGLRGVTSGQSTSGLRSRAARSWLC